MLSSFSSVCLWRNVCLGLLPLFDWVVCFLVLSCMYILSCCIFWRLLLCQLFPLLLFSPTLRAVADYGHILWYCRLGLQLRGDGDKVQHIIVDKIMIVSTNVLKPDYCCLAPYFINLSTLPLPPSVNFI